jgi:ubiquinone/menaquinone biosynthesis C-methylase UbiE
MHKVLNSIGYASTVGLSIAATAEIGLRAGWRMNPRPMPHQFARWLDHSWRLAYRNPGETLGLYGFEAGMSVLDAGCGSGLFTAEMARMVGPEGMVHAVDLQLPCLVQASRRLAEAELSDRVRLHHRGLYALPLLNESIDLAVIIAALGEVPEPLLALAEIKRVLKVGARIAISEEIPDPAYLPARQVRQLMEETGFRYGGKSGSAFCYSMIFFNDIE